MIEVRNLTKRYRDLVAIEDVSFDVAKGEILGFLGRNGAGKTTTMRILTGFLPASSGTARVAGFDVFEQPLEVKHRVGYLPEQPPVYLDMTVWAYLKFVADIKGVPKAKVKDELERVANLTSIAAVMDRVIINLSKGFRQRVGLAQALLNDPEVLILDEPTVGLDPILRERLWRLFRELADAGATLLVSSHVMDEAGRCDEVLLVRDGRLLAQATPADLVRDTGATDLDGAFLALAERER